MRIRRSPGLPAAGDWLLAAALGALGVCEVFIRSLNADFHGPRALDILVVLLIAVAVIWRRRVPLAALVIYWIPAQVWLDLTYGSHSNLPVEPLLVLLILVYSAASFTDGRGHQAVLAVLAALYVSELALLLAGRKGLGNVVPGLVFITLAYVLGRGVRTRRAHAASLEHRAVELEREQEALARQAVIAERDRIARELHDVIAHSVTVIIVQAGAAQRLLDRDLAGAHRTLETIRTSGSEALDELRRLLGLMREAPAADSAVEPQPGIARLGSLIEQTQELGLPVDYVVDGAQRAVPPGIDLAVYRIVQEALTNIRKHAGPAKARVQLEFLSNELEILVCDDGKGALKGVNGAGHGLIGMSERVALYGGTLTSGPRSSGGFEVRVRIPLHGAPA